MVVGAAAVTTSIIVFCDDDVMWPKSMLGWCLYPFEDSQIGAGGTSQAAMPDGNFMTIWEILASYRLSMRNVEISATAFIDSGISCLSGRTACYRTYMVQDPAFSQAFLNEIWRGKYHQHSGDDKFLTRWVQSHNMRTWIQACDEAELITTFKPNWMFLIQLLRWTRNTWRSDIRALFYERFIWKSSPYTAFTMFDRLFNPITLCYGIVYMLVRMVNHKPLSNHIAQSNIVLTYFLWLLMIRFVKYWPHLIRRPQDLMALPLFVMFQYMFIFMKIYCLFTLHITDWGTRAGIGAAEPAVVVPENKKLEEVEEESEMESRTTYSMGDGVDPMKDAADPLAEDPYAEYPLKSVSVSPVISPVTSPPVAASPVKRKFRFI